MLLISAEITSILITALPMTDMLVYDFIPFNQHTSPEVAQQTPSRHLCLCSADAFTTAERWAIYMCSWETTALILISYSLLAPQ